MYVTVVIKDSGLLLGASVELIKQWDIILRKYYCFRESKVFGVNKKAKREFETVDSLCNLRFIENS